MLKVFVDDLIRLGLYEAVRASCFGSASAYPLLAPFSRCLVRHWDILYTTQRTRDGNPRDVRSIKSLNGFVTIRVFFMYRRVSTIGEEGTDPLRDISRAYVPFLHNLDLHSSRGATNRTRILHYLLVHFYTYYVINLLITLS